jgi:hypothetical protein
MGCRSRARQTLLLDELVLAEGDDGDLPAVPRQTTWPT